MFHSASVPKGGGVAESVAARQQAKTTINRRKFLQSTPALTVLMRGVFISPRITAT